VSRDPLVRRSIDALRDIPDIEGLKEEEYELRLLTIPGALLEAFWLKSKTDRQDFIVPVLAPPGDVEVGRTYSADEFLNLAAALAQRFREFDEAEGEARLA
jgi:hypothetical protein